MQRSTLGPPLRIPFCSAFQQASWSVACPAVDGGRVRRYLTNMITTVSSKGQIVLPAAIRRQDAIKPGQEFEVERIDEGEYLLKRTKGRRNQGLVKLLLAC